MHEKTARFEQYDKVLIWNIVAAVIFPTVGQLSRPNDHIFCNILFLLMTAKKFGSRRVKPGGLYYT